MRWTAAISIAHVRMEKKNLAEELEALDTAKARDPKNDKPWEQLQVMEWTNVD